MLHINKTQVLSIVETLSSFSITFWWLSLFVLLLVFSIDATQQARNQGVTKHFNPPKHQTLFGL